MRARVLISGGLAPPTSPRVGSPRASSSVTPTAYLCWLLSSKLSALLKGLLTRSLRAQRAQLTHRFETVLSGGFERVLAIDFNVSNPRDALTDIWRVCAHARSALERHAIVNVFELQPVLKLTSQATVCG